MKKYLLLFFIITTNLSHGSCLSDLTIKKEAQSYFSCKEDNDCTFYKDACRSCGKSVLAVNRHFEKNLKNLDYNLRKENNCYISCEACSTNLIKTKCFKNKCILN